MPHEPVEARKRVLRAAARALPAESREAAADLAQRNLLELPELSRASSLELYAAQAHEVPTALLVASLDERGATLLFPRVADGELQLYRARGLHELRLGYRGILEPEGEGPAPVESVDVFVVPGLLFDRAGRRLGRGAGHFDRLLGRAREGALRIGLCYAQRVVRELPVAPWDVPMHIVVTEQEVIRPTRAEEGA